MSRTIASPQGRPIFSGFVVVHADDAEAALAEAAILGQRRADLARADDDHPPLVPEAQDLAELAR